MVPLALVTGGGGFVGSAVIKLLLKRGWHVRSLARHDYPRLRKIGVQTIQGDITIAAAVADAVRGCDAVFHTAAKAGVWGPAAEYESINIHGTENVIAACRDLTVPRLIFTSSPSVVFANADQPNVDETAPYPDDKQFLAHYPRTKAAAERLVLAANDAELRTVALRPHLIWGPGDHHLVPRIVSRAKAGKLRLIVDPNAPADAPSPLVDSTYIDNAALAHVLAAETLADESRAARCAGRPYFITNNEPMPINELISRIVAAANAPPVKRTISPAAAYRAGMICEAAYKLFARTSEPPMTRFVAKQLTTAHYFDITAARRDLLYEPIVSNDEGMRRLAAWFAVPHAE
jgi:nucleoside-diphosphate-sugar epimerase